MNYTQRTTSIIISLPISIIINIITTIIIIITIFQQLAIITSSSLPYLTLPYHPCAAVTRSCHALRTRFRLILTGTPVHNNLHEFGALLHFLVPNLFTDLSLFDAAFNLRGPGRDKKARDNSRKVVVSQEDSEAGGEDGGGGGRGGGGGGGGAAAPTQLINRSLLESARYLMKPFVLRRLKSEVEQRLPPKLETRINCSMSKVQRELTKALLFKEQLLLTRLDLEHRDGSQGGGSQGLFNPDESAGLTTVSSSSSSEGSPSTDTFSMPGKRKGWLAALRS